MGGGLDSCVIVIIQVYVLTEAAIAPPQQGIALNHILMILMIS